MRIYTILEESEIRDALSVSKERGYVANDVEFAVLAFMGKSRNGLNRYEVRLGSNTLSRDPNTAKKRRVSASYNGYRYGATWHEWGYVMADIYDRDHSARFGSVYESESDFHDKTRYEFLSYEDRNYIHGGYRQYRLTQIS